MTRVVLLLTVAACWRGSSPPPPEPVTNTAPAPAPARRPVPRPVDDAERVMEVMQRFTDDMCNCHDSACAQAVADEMTRWSQDESKRQTEPPKLTEEQVQQAAAIGEHMGRCMQNAMTGSASP